MFTAQEEFYAAGPTRLELWDMSDADLSQVTVSGMQKFISSEAHLGNARQGGQSAVITKANLQYGLGRMAEILVEFESLPFAFRVFRKRDERIAPGAQEMVYFRDVTDFKISFREGQKLVDSYQETKALKMIKATTFICETDLAYGIARMLQIFLEVMNPEHTVVVTKPDKK